MSARLCRARALPGSWWSWMAGVALLLAVLTIGGLIGPLALLILTFALSAGDAFETPSWRAVLPDLVKKEDLPAASALNGIEFNFARAVGPGLAGVVIAAAGAGTAFLGNAVSFVGVIFAVARWKRPIHKRDDATGNSHGRHRGGNPVFP